MTRFSMSRLSWKDAKRSDEQQVREGFMYFIASLVHTSRSRSAHIRNACPPSDCLRSLYTMWMKANRAGMEVSLRKRRISFSTVL